MAPPATSRTRRTCRGTSVERNWTFLGKEWDPDESLYYFGARYSTRTPMYGGVPIRLLVSTCEARRVVMGPEEQQAMVSTGRVQESTLNGVTSVSTPPDPTSWVRQTAGSNYVEFDVPTSAVRGAGSNAKIYGPNSIFGPKLGITEMPPAANIVHTACKVCP